MKTSNSNKSHLRETQPKIEPSIGPTTGILEIGGGGGGGGGGAWDCWAALSASMKEKSYHEIENGLSRFIFRNIQVQIRLGEQYKIYIYAWISVQVSVQWKNKISGKTFFFTQWMKLSWSAHFRLFNSN